jgi:formylglycine-generating enzyme required for sulfatase activity
VLTVTGVGTATITATQGATGNWLTGKISAQFLSKTPDPSSDVFGSGSNAYSIAFVPVGNPGNSNDTTGYGGVPYEYRIGTYTISQNQVDAAVRNGLQNVIAGPWTGDAPAANVSWYESAAYVNWLNTSKGYPPAYNLTWSNGAWNMALWSTTNDSNGNVAWILGGTNLYRNANAVYFLPSENEWYKAAYYDPNKNRSLGGYWLYPTGGDSAPTPVVSGTNIGTAVYNQTNSKLPASVFEPGGFSPYGTMGQGGNVWQWTETSLSKLNNNPQESRVLRGGEWRLDERYLRSYRYSVSPDISYSSRGFRVLKKMFTNAPGAPFLPQLGNFLLPSVTYGSAPIILYPPVSTSLGLWGYTSDNTNVATVSGGVLTVTGVGTATIIATQGANGNYAAASTSTTITVTAGTPVLGSFAIPTTVYGSSPFTITPPTSSSSGLWGYTSDNTNVATVSGGVLTVTGVGTATITATQGATGNWLTGKISAQFLSKTPDPSSDVFGSGSNAYSIAFVPVGNPGNSNDTTGYGGVPYEYRIGTYTISQNQVDAAVRNGLQNVAAGPFNGDEPAASVSWYEAAAYVNWLNTSKGYPPAYNLTWSNGAWNMTLWSTTNDSNGNTAWILGGTNLYRNANAVYFLPSENEWYKAACYDSKKNSDLGGYWLYPTASDTDPTPKQSGTNAGTAVCSRQSGPASVYLAGGLSAYRTMGQGGNIWQWMETSLSSSNTNTEENRVYRGGDWYNGPKSIYFRNNASPYDSVHWISFRVAKKP